MTLLQAGKANVNANVSVRLGFGPVLHFPRAIVP